MKSHVLIVDDDEMIQAMVSFLAKEGSNLRTSQAGTGAQMHEILKRDSVDLVVLDLGLPDEDGLALSRQIRARSDVPIIVLTGDQSRESLIAALEIGVNDFLTKPFDPYELQLRIRNQIRHFRRSHRTETRDAGTDRLRFAGYVIDLSRRSLETADGERIHLTPNEFNILAMLAQKANRALSRNQILDALAIGDEVPSDRAVDVYIAQIRKKIEADPRSPRLIQAVRGFGYILSQSLTAEP